MNKRGQALVEFVMIMPIAIMIIFLVCDFGRIYFEKTKLENNTNDAINVYLEKRKIDDVSSYVKKIDKNISFSIKDKEDNYFEISLIKPINIFTPGLNLIIGSPYKIKTVRVLKYE